ncbi:urotensin 1 [Parambassis ranga]|uniref:Urotensin 1 n=1 Tax=Parambassis ranga TaxID=210632 RepID=A0A6P7HUX3_9TELE|nr:urocortin [Parambassis ranga]
MYKTLRSSPVAAHRDFLRLDPDDLTGRPPSSAAACGQYKDMKPVPLLLLLSSVLLSSHVRPAAGRPRIFPGWLDGSGRLQTQRLDEVLLRAAAAGDGTASDLLSGNILRFVQRRNPDRLHLLPPEDESAEEEEEETAAMRTAAQLLKRSEEPPLSIDLTFHLLRNMIQMAKMESQREQAQLNRKVLDEVGK